MEKLAKQYRKWCARNYLPVMGAKELLAEGILSDDQYFWLQGFIERWEKAC